MLGRQRQDEIFRYIAADMNWKVCFVDTQEDADARCVKFYSLNPINIRPCLRSSKNGRLLWHLKVILPS